MSGALLEKLLVLGEYSLPGVHGYKYVFLDHHA